ncbi:MAG: ABC transporter permease [Bacilli bacterium]|nr:ABC transporter permease [Bacilli bacterium]
MGKYILKRLALAVVTLVIILSLTFILIKLLPFEQPVGMTDAKLAYYSQQIHLGYVVSFDHEVSGYGDCLFHYVSSGSGPKIQAYYYQTPIWQQYFSWLKNIFTEWNWGTSVKVEMNRSAIAIITERLPVSMSLNIISVIFSVPLGIILGIVAALNKNKPVDHIISTLVMVFISIPSFVLIVFSVWLFAYQLNWLPAAWAKPTDPTSVKIASYVIPVFALSFGSVCGYCRFVRAELCEVMESEYLLLARTKGLTKRQAIIRHALRNAMVPIVPAILAEFIGILGGSTILERLYGIPGIGGLFYDALNAKDYNVLFVDMALFTTISLVSGVFLDLSYGLIDPRIRMGAKK